LGFVDGAEKGMMAIAQGVRIVCLRAYEESDLRHRLPDCEIQEFIVEGPNKITHFYEHICSETS
jgi:hypothetical protein